MTPRMGSIFTCSDGSVAGLGLLRQLLAAQGAKEHEHLGRVRAMDDLLLHNGDYIAHSKEQLDTRDGIQFHLQ